MAQPETKKLDITNKVYKPTGNLITSERTPFDITNEVCEPNNLTKPETNTSDEVHDSDKFVSFKKQVNPFYENESHTKSSISRKPKATPFDDDESEAFDSGNIRKPEATPFDEEESEEYYDEDWNNKTSQDSIFKQPNIPSCCSNCEKEIKELLELYGLNKSDVSGILDDTLSEKGLAVYYITRYLREDIKEIDERFLLDDTYATKSELIENTECQRCLEFANSDLVSQEYDTHNIQPEIKIEAKMKTDNDFSEHNLNELRANKFIDGFLVTDLNQIMANRFVDDFSELDLDKFVAERKKSAENLAKIALNLDLLKYDKIIEYKDIGNKAALSQHLKNLNLQSFVNDISDTTRYGVLDTECIANLCEGITLLMSDLMYWKDILNKKEELQLKEIQSEDGDSLITDSSMLNEAFEKLDALQLEIKDVDKQIKGLDTLVLEIDKLINWDLEIVEVLESEKEAKETKESSFSIKKEETYHKASLFKTGVTKSFNSFSNKNSATDYKNNSKIVNAVKPKNISKDFNKDLKDNLVVPEKQNCSQNKNIKNKSSDIRSDEIFERPDNVQEIKKINISSTIQSQHNSSFIDSNLQISQDKAYATEIGKYNED